MKFSQVLLIGLFLSLTSNATIRRVGFTEVPAVAGVDYTTFYAAYQAATAGDTIYIFPGRTISQNGWPTFAGRAEIAKRLVIVGKGSWLDSAGSPRGNFGYQATKGISYLGGQTTDFNRGVYFFPGSEGSIIMGFDGQGQYIVPEANNITIKSNFNLLVWLGNRVVSNLTIEKNYRVWFNGESSNAFTWSNLTIRNNFIYQFALPYHSYSGSITNNTFAYDNSGSANGGDPAMSYMCVGCCCDQFYTNSRIDLQAGNWIFENNLIVFYQGNTSVRSPFEIINAASSFLNYNVAIESTNVVIWPGINSTGNKFLPPAQVADLFEAFPAIGTSSADGRYRLKANSPAKAGSALRPDATVDAGMYGGLTPYKLSMIPSIPTIYSINSPQGNTPAGSTIQVTISTRSNN